MTAGELARAEELHTAGDSALRIIATEPATSGIYRFDQIIAATARNRLWLTDAYFVGLPSYVEALRAAALDGDLENATELVLGASRRKMAAGPQRLAGHHRRREDSAVAAAGAVRLGNAVGAALGGYRLLGPAEASLLLGAGAVLAAIAALALVVPWLVLAPVVALLTWFGLALIVHSVKVRR